MSIFIPEHRRLLRLAVFHIASAMIDILVCSVWNRIMIKELGYPAWPVALLLAMRYLLSPVGLYFGYLSDTKMLLGRYRVSYIWLGRSFMILALPLLTFSLSNLSSGPQNSTYGWLYAILAFSCYGIGSLSSGSPYLALVRESVCPAKRGLAIAFVETVLIAFFPIWAIIFGLMMEYYTLESFVEMTKLAVLVAAFCWFIPLIGIEQINLEQEKQTRPDFLIAIKTAWRDQGTRSFFFFLSLASLSAWIQDAILEPFGADVFSLTIGESTRLNSLWLSATLFALLLSFWLFRSLPDKAHVERARSGLIIMSAGMSSLALSSLMLSLPLLYLALLFFGLGFGIYTYSGLNLMSCMTNPVWAGTLMGFWTIAQVVSRGLGISLGGVMRDVLLMLTLSDKLAYSMLFALSAIGLSCATLLLRKVDFSALSSKTLEHSN